MALHARLFKHNVLRVSKLKKLSHTTQAIEWNYDGSAVTCDAFSKTSCADKTKLPEAEKRPSDSWSLSLLSQWSPQQLPLDLFIVTSSPACQHPTASHQERIPSRCTNLDIVTSDKLRDREKSLTALLFPQDSLPFVVKSVSYTTDDIMTGPVDKGSLMNEHGVLCYENHAVTVLTECENAVQHPVTKRNQCKDTHTAEAGLSVSDKPSARRHSICDSNPARCQPQFRDCPTLLPGIGSGTEALLCSSGSDTPQSSEGSPKSPGDGQIPNLDQLKAVEAYFIEALPRFFKSRLDYRVYHPDIVFENNFWGDNEVSVGINQYAMQMTKLRALTHLKYAHVHMEVVSSTCVPEEGAIRIQWRIVGLSQLKALRFWKYTFWRYKDSFREDAEWLEGISILHINKDGLVIKHRMDRMTPDEDQAVKAPSLAAKLALLFGLTVPRPRLSDYTSLLCRR